MTKQDQPDAIPESLIEVEDLLKKVRLRAPELDDEAFDRVFTAVTQKVARSSLDVPDQKRAELRSKEPLNIPADDSPRPTRRGFCKISWGSLVVSWTSGLVAGLLIMFCIGSLHSGNDNTKTIVNAECVVIESSTGMDAIVIQGPAVQQEKPRLQEFTPREESRFASTSSRAMQQYYMAEAMAGIPGQELYLDPYSHYPLLRHTGYRTGDEFQEGSDTPPDLDDEPYEFKSIEPTETYRAIDRNRINELFDPTRRYAL